MSSQGNPFLRMYVAISLLTDDKSLTQLLTCSTKYTYFKTPNITERWKITSTVPFSKSIWGFILEYFLLREDKYLSDTSYLYFKTQIAFEN